MRFKQTALMCSAIDKSYQTNGIYDLQGNQLRFSGTQNSIDYFQSRRIYYVTILSLIPAIAEGQKTIDYIDTLNYLQYTLDSCLVGITTSYYNLLINECLTDFELVSDGECTEPLILGLISTAIIQIILFSSIFTNGKTKTLQEAKRVVMRLACF